MDKKYVAIVWENRLLSLAMIAKNNGDILLFDSECKAKEFAKIVEQSVDNAVIVTHFELANKLCNKQTLKIL